MNNQFEMVAKTFQGLEDVLRDELVDLGADDVEIGRRMVSFRGDKRMLYKANLCLRTALRILKPIVKFSASNPDELYDAVRDFPWDEYLKPDGTFCIDATVNSAEFPNSRFATYRVKDGIADFFNDKYRRRPSIRLNGADLRLNVHITDDRVTISMDSSGETLNKRGYRQEQTEAPLNEVLAAGLILKTGWRGDCDLVDPMCGSGTFLVEAALIAANINPGVFRQHYAFETWPDFDRELFEELYNDDSGERDPHCRILGGDIAREAVAISQRNIKAAGVENFVEVDCRPFQDWTMPPKDGMLITNPPYGERLKTEDIEGLYSDLGSTLKRYFKGYHAWILGYRDEHFQQIGLKPSVTFPVLNGALECELHEYVLFEGTYEDFRRAGGSVRNEEFHREPRVRHQRESDEEWNRQTRKFSGRRPAKFRQDDSDRDHKPYDRDRKPYDRDRKPFDRDRKPYDRDRKPYDRDRKPHDRDRKPYDRENKPYDRERRQPKITTPKGPSIGAESETRYAPPAPLTRHRRGWKKPETEDNNND